MKLAQIFVSRESWKLLSALKMPPHTAYKLLKYVKRVDAEFELIESQRVKLLNEQLEVKRGRLPEDTKEEDKNSLQPADPEYAVFVTGFGEVLDTESDLKPFNATMDFILDLAGKQAENLLAARDIGLLEPFFEEPKE